MRMFYFLFCVVGLSHFSLAETDEPSKAPAVQEITFTGEALKLKNYLVELFETSKKVNAPSVSERNAARAKIEGAMDWNRVAEDCLGKRNWVKQSEKGRAEFRQLLRDVIINTAYGRLDKFWKDADYKFEAFEMGKGVARVPSQFLTGDSSFTLEYYLHQRDGRWMIYDIAFEGERYSTNINMQIDAFLKEKPFQELIGKLKKRKEDLLSAKPKKT